ncbi:MAG TPA: alpha/beta hydrolase-fold protein [Lacunisphaera sp.]|nr:alpha/beta hydrolase-fold protein [Lacunisphaera sp.]
MPPPRKPESTLRLHRRFCSHGLRNSRDIVVWLPPGYGLARRRHPVVYFQDGQNIFDPATAFLGNAWHAGDRATELIRAHEIAAPIMVGVYNTGFNRMNEYAPTAGEFSGWDGEKCQSTGDAKRYAKFFVQEVKPFIDARYLTLPGPRHTAVVGSSMGGLVSLYFALWHPRVFGHVAALSPSLWWGDRVVLRDFSRLRKKPDVRLWLDMGTVEPGWEIIRLMRETLVNRGWKPGEDLAYHEVPEAQHTEHAWGARVGGVLKFILGRKPGGRRAQI